MTIKAALAVFLVLIATGAEATIERYSGSAYSDGASTLLYQEVHYVYADGKQRLVLYRCPDGRAFARKRVRIGGNAQTPDFDLVDAHLGYREGVRNEGSAREVYVQRRPEAPEQADVVQVPTDGVIDTGFDAFAQKHWDQLVRGDTLHFPYLVPSRRTFYQFKVSRLDSATTPPGAMTIRLSSGSWFAFLLPHIDVSYDIASHRVVRYEGLSNIRDDNGKNYRIHAEYPAIAHTADIAQAEVDAALTVPLASACTLPDSALSASGQPTTLPEVTTAPPARNPNP